MDLSNVDYKLLKALDAVVMEQSFDRAAQRLFITQSAVSQRIKLLEKHFGEPLLIRSTPPQASHLGRLLLGHYQRVLQLEMELNQQLDLQSNQAQTLPLAVNADSLASYICVASPDFIARFFKQGVNRQTLQHAPAMSFDQYEDMHLAFLREHFDLEMGQYPCHTIRSSEAFVDLTLASGAYSFNSHFSVEVHLKSGQLMDILPEHKVRVPLYWHCWQLGGELMQDLSEQVISYARQVLK